ncbi:MAG: hypothetical protein ACJ72L_13705 [Marmoricola sp.]
MSAVPDEPADLADDAVLPGDDSGLPADDPTEVEYDDEDLDDEEAPPPPPKPYVFDSAHVSLAAEALDAALADAPDSPGGWGLVESALEARGGVVDEALARELSAIGGRSLKTGGFAEPDTHFVADVFWPAPKDASADVVALWREALDQVTHPAAIARLEEMLLARRDGNLPARARHAATSYLAAVAGLEDDLTTCAYLTRAWTISRVFKLTDVEDHVLDEIEGRVDRADVRAHMGRVMPLLAVMTCTPSNTARQLVLHAKAETILADIVNVETMHHVISGAGELRRQMIVPGPDADVRRAQTRHDEMAALRRIATAANHPLVQQSHLETAARFATRHNLRADLKEIQRDLEAVSGSDLGMTRISSTAHIPSWIPESDLHAYTHGYTWHSGLLYFLLSPVPCGDVDKIWESTRSRGFSLRHLFSTVLLGADGLPRKTLNTEEEKLEHDVSQHVAIASQHRGYNFAAGLHRLAEEFGIPTEDELTTFFLDTFKCDPGGARILAKALRHFWARDYLETAYLAAPATEAAARRLLRELDEGVYQVQVGKNPGKYPALGTLLDALLDFGLDPSWHYFLSWLLLGPDGSNIRNDVAHGFTVGMDGVHAALVLRAASVLVTATGSVEGETKTLTLAKPSEPRLGLRGLADRALAVTSRNLLRGHMLLESRRYRRYRR